MTANAEMTVTTALLDKAEVIMDYIKKEHVIAPCYQTGVLVNIHDVYVELGLDVDYARFRDMEKVIREIYNLEVE